MTKSAAVLELMPDPPHALLGALIRRRYKEQGMSMEALAERAGLSRSTVHRTINASKVDIVPEATNIASIALAAGVTDDEVRETIADEALRREVLLWMGQEKVLALRDYSRSHAPRAHPDDLVIVGPGGTAGGIHLEARGEEREAAIRQLGDILRTAGWIAARPLEEGSG